MKFLFGAVVALGVGLGPGMWAARRKRRAEGDSRIWLARVLVAVFGVLWVAAILLIVKEIW
jgi:hypothetical protein